MTAASHESMRGRRVVVTGATTGIGKETARALAKMGAEVVIVGRDAGKIAETVRELGGQSVRCDFASLASVRAAAAELRERFPQIHVLVNNAGAVYMERALTSDGHETTLQVNHLGPYLLTRLVLPSVVAAATPERAARIVNVASVVHGSAQLDFDDLHCAASTYVGLRVYGRAKLMNVMFTYALARRMRERGANVTVNCLHPGVIASGFGSNNKGWMGFVVKIVAPFLTTPAKGARTSVFLASSPEVERVTGTYFDERSRQVPSSALSRDENAQEKLWQVSEALCGDAFP